MTEAPIKDLWCLLCAPAVFAANPELTEIVVDGEVVVLVWDNPYNIDLGVSMG